MPTNTKLHIMMVEDNAGDEFLLSELLKSSGLSIHQVYIAERLYDAVSLLRQHHVDLILLDLSLPDSSGIDSFKMMRVAAVNIPIIILSGLTDMKVALDAISLGAQDYLIKGDFDEKMLSKTILYSLERMRSMRQLKESNERYNLISNATNDMVWEWDIITGEVFRNKEGWKKIFKGSNPPESGTIEDWSARIHPDDRGIASYVYEQISDKQINTFETEYRVLRDDGNFAYIHDRGTIFRNEEGAPLRLIGATQDITEKKEAEMQVVKSEVRFRSLVQNSSDLISILDNKGNYLYSSPAVKRILGYEPEYIIGKNAFSFIHPEDALVIKSQLNKENTRFNFPSNPFRFKHLDGTWRWLESKVTDATSDAEVQGFIFNSRDITERKLSEEEIKKLSIIARETLNMVIITDPEERIIWVNEAFTRITEFTFDEAIGRRPGELLQGEESNTEAVNYMRKEIKARRSFEVDVINYTKSGKKYWIRIQCQPQYDNDGLLQYFFAIETDVTKEKEADGILRASEERYRYLFNNNPASIFIWDIDQLEILEVNNTAVQQYGFSREEFLSKKIIELSSDEDRGKTNDLIKKARIAQDFKSINTWKHLKKSGEEMNMDISSHRIEYKGRPVILAIGSNITEKILLENVLEDERLARHKEITDAVISAQEEERQEIGRELHDNINQILASSRLYLGLAKTELEEGTPLLDETDTLISLAINEIRSLSHSLIPPSLNATDLLEALSNIIESNQLTSGIEISFEAPRFDESVIPDKLKLTIYRIVQEQFNNILKYAKASKVTVRLLQDMGNIFLSIKDNGVGFDTSKKASGVGLINIKTRVSLFNGEVTVISTPQKGCELKVYFPEPLLT